MKFLNLVLIFVVALVCLLSLQASWLHHTYQLRCRSIEKSIDSIFSQTIEKELDHRFFELRKEVSNHQVGMDMRIDSFQFHYNGLESNINNESVISQQLDIVQRIMTRHNILFNLSQVDSIFSSLLDLNQYPFQYQINQIDSVGRIIGTAGQMIDKGFKTVVLPVINGERTYAIVKITAPVVFKHMLAILIVSILIICFIIICLIYEIKVFIYQQHIIRLREDFTHALTHNMKTPLATIHSVLIQLDKGSIDKSPDLRQKFTTIAIEQVINLQTTVNQILTLAYIEDKQLSLNKQSIDLPLMVQALIDKFNVKSNKNIVFQASCDLKNNVVLADPYYLENALSNLIDNAIKYSGDSVKIEIECKLGRNRFYIHVRDNGFGISSNDQLRIFKQFERGAEIKRNQSTGFGIGLNYVQQVIEAHGGTVLVVSQEGVGSEFIITLPMQ